MKKKIIVTAAAALLLAGCTSSLSESKRVTPSPEPNTEITVKPSVEKTVEPTAAPGSTSALTLIEAKPNVKPKSSKSAMAKQSRKSTTVKILGKTMSQPKTNDPRFLDREKAKNKPDERRQIENSSREEADQEDSKGQWLSKQVNADTETMRLYALAASAGIPRAANHKYCGKIGHVKGTGGADGLWGSRAHKALITSPVHGLWIKKSWVEVIQRSNGKVAIYHADIWGCDP